MAGLARGGADERLDAGARWRRWGGTAGWNNQRAEERAPASDPDIRGQTVPRALDEVTAFLRMRATGFLMKTVERSTSHHGWPLSDRVAWSEHGCGLEKERVALRGPLTERGGAPLVRDLNRPEWRPIPVHEDDLGVLSIDGGVGLKEQPQE